MEWAQCRAAREDEFRNPPDLGAMIWSGWRTTTYGRNERGPFDFLLNKYIKRDLKSKAIYMKGLKV